MANAATNIILAPIMNRKINRLKKGCNQIETRQTNLTMAYGTLKKASERIEATITALTEQDYNAHGTTIEGLKLTPEYKQSLKNELENSRKNAIETLKPLLEKAERLKGNMIVTQEKAIHYIGIVKAQAEVMRAGEIQVTLINGLQNAGQDMAERIEELMLETERINNVTNDAIAGFDSSKSTSIAGSYLGSNPILQSKSV